MAVIKIDPDKLTKEFEKRNLIKGDVSEAMGTTAIICLILSDEKQFPSMQWYSCIKITTLI